MTTALLVDHQQGHGHSREELARAMLALLLLMVVLLFAKSLLVTNGRTADSAALKAHIEQLSGSPVKTVHFYDIDATDLPGIKAQLRERGPVARGKRFEGRTDWRISWRWSGLPDGSCGTANATAWLDLEVTLPRLTSNVSPEVADKWTRYLSALVRHETSHARIAAEHLSAVQDRLRRSSCADANASAERELDVIRLRNARYDSDTNHGAREGVSLN